MSRHDVTGKDPALEIIVGWDNPLQTFFAQVLRPACDDEDDSVLVWVGTAWQKCPSPDDLVTKLAAYADLSEEQLSRLRLDRAEAAQTRPSALQVHMGRLLAPRASAREE